MVVIQQVLFELETDYAGHPYWVTGHALYTALARRLEPAAKQRLAVSNGVFLPGEHGAYPAWHSHSGGVPFLGTGLRPVESYADLFLFRDAAQRWLSASRPRDAHNVHDMHTHGGRQAFAPTTRFGRPGDVRGTKRTVRWRVQCYLHTGRGVDAVLPVSDAVLDGLRVGSARNYGFGELSLAETQLVDLDALDYSRLEAAVDDPGVNIELLAPYVTASTYPGAAGQSVPWWWDTAGGLRRRATRLQKGSDRYRVETIDHGQVVGYAGDRPVETAVNGVLRVGTHAKYGFGEFRLRPANRDRVPVRAAGGKGGEV